MTTPPNDSNPNTRQFEDGDVQINVNAPPEADVFVTIETHVDEQAAPLVQTEAIPSTTVTQPLVSEQIVTRETQVIRNPELINDTLTIPIAAEEIQVDRRKFVTGVVRIKKQVQERVETIDQPLYTESVTVQEVPINRPIDAIPSVRYEGETMIVPVVEEVTIVQKRLILKSELHVVKVKGERREPQEVILRSEQVSIERHDSISDPNFDKTYGMEVNSASGIVSESGTAGDEEYSFNDAPQ